MRSRYEVEAELKHVCELRGITFQDAMAEITRRHEIGIHMVERNDFFTLSDALLRDIKAARWPIPKSMEVPKEMREPLNLQARWLRRDLWKVRALPRERSQFECDNIVRELARCGQADHVLLAKYGKDLIKALGIPRIVWWLNGVLKKKK